MPHSAFLPPVPFPTPLHSHLPYSKSPLHHLPPLNKPQTASLCLPQLTTTKSPPLILTVDPFSHPPPANPPSPKNPILIIPGFAADASSYAPMASTLKATLPPSTYVSVVPIRAHSWLSTFGGRPVTPILHIIHQAVQKTLKETGANAVTLVAHSAAGWIARIYLGYEKYPAERGKGWGGERWVNSLVCLGTPHKSKEWVTRNNMNFVNDVYPGGFWKGVKYLNFGGDGGTFENGGGVGGWFCRLSYRITDSERGGVEGDGIVPLSVAFLEKADLNVRLKGVWHSSTSNGPWYGDPSVIGYWSRFLD